MKNKSTFFERITQIIDTYNIGSVNVFAKQYLGYASSEKINRLKDEKKHPSFEILVDISNKFEEINMNWLITGNGEMFRKSDDPVTPSRTDDHIDRLIGILQNTVSEKDAQIQNLQGIIKDLIEKNGENRAVDNSEKLG